MKKFGVANGYLPGQFGVWGEWEGSLEVVRVLLRVQPPHGEPLPAFSYSFIPSHDASFCRSLAVPYAVLELIRGKQAESDLRFEIEFLLGDGSKHVHAIDQVAFTRAVHGKTKRVKGLATQSTVVPDSEELASLDVEQLRAKSTDWRAARAEKERLEAEAKAKAVAEIEAKIKADAAKSAQASVPAAKAASSGDPKTPTLPACKTILVYGSSTGNTKNIAEMLKDALGTVDYVKNVTEITPADFSVAENIILGIPTWHIGELQDDWAAMLPVIESVNPNVTGKKVAIFGLGDQKGYPDTYVDGIQMLWEPFEKRGAKLFGLWPTKGYEFKASKALKGDKFMGLVIDIENQDHLSDGRVKVWAAQIKVEMGL